MVDEAPTVPVSEKAVESPSEPESTPASPADEEMTETSLTEESSPTEETLAEPTLSESPAVEKNGEEASTFGGTLELSGNDGPGPVNVGPYNYVSK
ncbi:MAG: hypothetical protein Q4G11_07065, partial [Gallicola sp.]|nr:hypothetical protein [Gallicola sp.]